MDDRFIRFDPMDRKNDVRYCTYDVQVLAPPDREMAVVVVTQMSLASNRWGVYTNITVIVTAEV